MPNTYRHQASSVMGLQKPLVCILMTEAFVEPRATLTTYLTRVVFSL